MNYPHIKSALSIFVSVSCFILLGISTAIWGLVFFVFSSDTPSLSSGGNFLVSNIIAILSVIFLGSFLKEIHRQVTARTPVPLRALGGFMATVLIASVLLAQLNCTRCISEEFRARGALSRYQEYMRTHSLGSDIQADSALNTYDKERFSRIYVDDKQRYCMNIKQNHFLGIPITKGTPYCLEQTPVGTPVLFPTDFRWRVEHAPNFEETMPRHVVYLDVFGKSYRAGESIGCFGDTKPKEDHELSRKQCWFGGGGDIYSVFLENGSYVLKHKWIQETGGPEVQADPEGPWETVLNIM